MAGDPHGMMLHSLHSQILRASNKPLSEQMWNVKLCDPSFCVSCPGLLCGNESGCRPRSRAPSLCLTVLFCEGPCTSSLVPAASIQLSSCSTLHSLGSLLIPFVHSAILQIACFACLLPWICSAHGPRARFADTLSFFC